MSFAADIININEMENTMRTDITKINEKSPHTELTEGLMVFAGGTSKMFQTGEWRTNTPIFHEDLCKQCLLCAPVCPDGSIPVKDSKRGAFDYDHISGLTSSGNEDQCSLLLSSRRRIAVMTFLVWSGKSPFIIHE